MNGEEQEIYAGGLRACGKKQCSSSGTDASVSSPRLYGGGHCGRGEDVGGLACAALVESV